MRGDNIPEGFEAGSIQQFTPEQMKLFRRSIKSVGKNSYLSRLAGGDQSMFAEMEAPANRQFQGQLGNLASRFSSQGMGSRHSSGFQNQATAASSNFAQDLQSRRQELQRQAILDMHNISQQLMGQRPKERDLFKKQEEQPSGWGSLAGGLVGGVGGAFVGQPVLGAQLGSAFGSQF